MFFLGKGYESIFDEFEILFALAVADMKKQEDNHIWGPIGRFGWKNRQHSTSPFRRPRDEAAKHESNWPPIKTGMFGGDYKRFEDIAEHYQTKIIDQIRWF